MAWNFGAEIHALTGFDAESSSNSATGETFQTHANRFLTDSAKEVIKLLPNRLLHLCVGTVETFTSGTPDTLNTGKIIFVTRTDNGIKYPCRKIEAFQSGRFNETGDMNKPTVTDPVFYIENNKIDVLPTAGTVLYHEVEFPTVEYDDNAIASYPDEAERAVVLGACIKAVQYLIAHEEDIELLVPMVGQLEKEYQKELSGLS
jgi:hypothetical protein